MKFRKKKGKFVQLFQPKFILIYVDWNHFPNKGERYQFLSLSIFLFTRKKLHTLTWFLSFCMTEREEILKKDSKDLLNIFTLTISSSINFSNRYTEFEANISYTCHSDIIKRGNFQFYTPYAELGAKIRFKLLEWNFHERILRVRFDRKLSTNTNCIRFYNKIWYNRNSSKIL